MLAVLKVSGHLYKHSHTVEKLVETIDTLVSQGTKFLIVPGGSIFADTVRELQLRTRLDDDTAHWMAIKAMEVYGLYIKSFSPRFVEAYTLEEIRRAVEENLVPIVMPYKFLREHDVLPHSWSVTSDSISIFIAHVVGAGLVILGKVVDGVRDAAGNLIRIARIEDVAHYTSDVIDAYAIPLARQYGIRIAVVNLTKPWLLQRVVNASLDDYTLIIP